MHETGWPFAMLVLWELGIGGEAGRRGGGLRPR